MFAWQRCVLLAVLTLVTAVAQAAPELYVVNQAAAAITVLNESTGEKLDNIEVPPGPVGLAFSKDGNRAYLSHPEMGRISVIDTAKRDVVETFDVGGMPFAIAVDEGTDRRLILFTDWKRNALVFVDPVSGAVIDLLATGKAPTAIAIDEERRRLYVANRDSGTLSILSADKPKLFARLETGRTPYALQLSTDGNQLYVADPRGNQVVVVDTGEDLVSRRIAVGHLPYGLAMTPDQKHLVVTNQGDNNVSLLTLTKEQSATTSIKVGRDPDGVVVTTAGDKAWVANWFDETLSLIDLDNQRELTTIDCAPGCRTIVRRPNSS